MPEKRNHDLGLEDKLFIQRLLGTDTVLSCCVSVPTERHDGGVKLPPVDRIPPKSRFDNRMGVIDHIAGR
jgi:hypothetical protein